MCAGGNPPSWSLLGPTPGECSADASLSHRFVSQFMAVGVDESGMNFG